MRWLSPPLLTRLPWLPLLVVKTQMLQLVALTLDDLQQMDDPQRLQNALRASRLSALRFRKSCIPSSAQTPMLLGSGMVDLAAEQGVTLSVDQIQVSSFSR